MNQRLRPVEFCPRCKQMIIGYREIVGYGWIVCECDKKKPVDKVVEKNSQKPFVFIEDKNEKKADI